MDSPGRVRLDRWLWAARFFKTRSLAAEAVQGGRVDVNGTRAKPSKELRVGDRVDLTIGSVAWTVDVRGLSDRRGPAPEAQRLYEETDESRERRERHAAQRRLAPAPGADLGARPTKRDRRR
ncbi:MAG TPA: RNA-binding S4 domain-containing protein, partial [Miltoncostaeaceae bacterium]|nr:RNA-binding S4 domain-containing protein [Miltoncostaeaceae bacterium]